jgi:hypothetical protein
VNDLAEIEPKITAFAREPNGGLICPSDSFTSVHRKAIISLAASHRLPTIYAWREFAPDGGLVTYGIESSRPVSARSAICRSHPTGRPSGRIADPAADQVRVCH